MTVLVSVIATVRNEEKTIRAFLDALLSQSRLPDEIIITDGGSTDHTAEMVRQYAERDSRVRLLLAPGNRSVGRNTAVRSAQYSIIACTDAGCVPARDWLKNITRPFEDHSTAVVAGFFEAMAHTRFQMCTAALMHPTRGEIGPATWLPSSRSVAFTKEAWAHVGGYPEWLSLNEDTPFDKALLTAGYIFRFATDAVVYWVPRSDLRGFAQQYFAYSRGDGQGWLDAMAYIRRTLRLTLGIVAVTAGVVVPWLWLPVLALVVFYFTRRCGKVYRRLKSIRAFLLAWVLALTYDVVSVFGFWRGGVERVLDARYRHQEAPPWMRSRSL